MQLHDNRWGYKKIANQANVTVSAAGDTIHQRKTHASTISQLRSGCPLYVKNSGPFSVFDMDFEEIHVNWVV